MAHPVWTMHFYNMRYSHSRVVLRRARLRCWGIASALLCEVGYALHLTGVVPINKNLCAGRLTLRTVTSTAA